MATREIYLRVVQVREGVEYILGLELRPADEIAVLKTTLKVRMRTACAGLMAGRWRDVAEAIEAMVVKHYPDRAYFIEVGHEADGWVQVWDPRGYARHAQ